MVLTLGVALAAAVLIGLAVRAHRLAGPAVDAWARERGLTLSDESRALVASYLQRSRSLRLVGAATGLVLATSVTATLADGRLDGVSPWLAAIAGYLVGIATAEATVRRPPGRRAAVRPRLLQDYLSPQAMGAQRRTAAGAAAIAIAALAVPVRQPELVPRWGRISLILGVVVVAVGTEVIQGWLIRRPQPVVSTSLIEADDAIRRQSVHSIAGAAIGMLCVLAGLALWPLAASDIQILRWTAWVPALLSVPIGFAACTYFESGGWQIRRTAP